MSSAVKLSWVVLPLQSLSHPALGKEMDYQPHPSPQQFQLVEVKRTQSPEIYG